LHIQLRRWDEMAKLEEQPFPFVQPYHAMMIRHLTNQSSD
jgi:hypothetical protein